MRSRQYIANIVVVTYINVVVNTILYAGGGLDVGIGL
jgi:hypothetical protein